MQVAYFFTTANVANEKLENDIVEKCLFAVKKKWNRDKRQPPSAKLRQWQQSWQ